MTILVKKVFISSKPTFVYLLCPPLCGPFSIQESAAGGLSYKEIRMCLGTFSRLAQSLATIYIFTQVHIPQYSFSVLRILYRRVLLWLQKMISAVTT